MRRLHPLAPLGFGVLLVGLLLAYSTLSPVSEGVAGRIRSDMLRLVAPIYEIANRVAVSVAGSWRHYFDLVNAAAENEQLHSEVAELHSQLTQYHELKIENERLRQLFKMAQTIQPHAIAARVIASNPAATIKTVVIDRGWADGVTKDRPVLAGAGLIGRVRMVAEHSAVVLLITDPSSAIDVLDSRSRERGLLVGTFQATELQRSYQLTQLEYLSHVSDIQVDDELVTSGMDGIYPKGLPVGRVYGVVKDAFGLMQSAWVLPLADLTHLEEVVIL